MSITPPPTKPPRGVKQGKETSGLLMSVIRTLSASETNEQREKERAKLEKEYKKSDARLDELVAEHASEIMEVMQKFNTTSAALSGWGQHCDAAVARLAACRSLLRLRRDDLRRLWADARTHHYALQMLTDIERVVISEREVREAIAAGRVLRAACTLRTQLDTASSTLAHVHALNTTTHHLEAKKTELVVIIVKSLSNAVFRGERHSPKRRTALLLAELTKTEDLTESYLQDMTPEFEASLSEEDKTFDVGVMLNLEALAELQQLKQAAEKFRVQIQSELLELIDTISRRIIDEGDVELEDECERDGDTQPDTGVTETNKPLARLVNILVEEFRAGAARNRRLLQLWRATLQRNMMQESCLHTEQHYWSAVQQVLQLLVREYLQIESIAASSRAVSDDSTQPELPLAEYFGKKRVPRTTKLFHFTAPSMGSPSAGARPHRHPLVCKPDGSNIHAVLSTLHTLCTHIETLTGGGECSLRAFITDYVRSGEAERLSKEARTAIDAAMKNPTAWREHTVVPGDNRAVYGCCVASWSAVERCVSGSVRLGQCGGEGCARGTLPALATLAAHCHAARQQPKLSPATAARWLADDDIVRFLQSLPNWKAATSTEPILEDKQYAQEMKQAYSREAEILGSSLGDGLVTRREIMADTPALLEVAKLGESMDWLSAKIKGIPAMLSQGGVKVSDKFVSDIMAAAAIFDDISHKCLLFLHLELRIQCFHHLGQEERAGGADERGGGATRLAHALLAFHEHAAALVAPRRLAYILNGLGEMMSLGVVWCCRGGSGGAPGATDARLATLRHCLAALQLPHDGLATAHHYTRLLASHPEEIIASIKDKGPQFTELEYLNAFKEIGASRGLSDHEMKAYLKQLSAALGHIGVTV